MLITQDGLKELGKIYYTSKFQGISWTSDMNQELPVVCSDPPLWRRLDRNLEGYDESAI